METALVILSVAVTTYTVSLPVLVWHMLRTTLRVRRLRRDVNKLDEVVAAYFQSTGAGTPEEQPSETLSKLLENGRAMKQ